MVNASVQWSGSETKERFRESNANLVSSAPTLKEKSVLRTFPFLLSPTFWLVGWCTTSFSVPLSRFISVCGHLSVIFRTHRDERYSRDGRLTSPSRECRFMRSSVSNFSFWLATTRGILNMSRGFGGWCSSPAAAAAAAGPKGNPESKTRRRTSKKTLLLTMLTES